MHRIFRNLKKWSILISCNNNQKNEFNYIYNKLNYLINKEKLNESIEILYLINDENISSNRKLLIEKSKSEWINFIDVNIDISNNFINEIFKNLDTDYIKFKKHFVNQNKSLIIENDYSFVIKKSLISDNYYNNNFFKPINSKILDNVLIFEKNEKKENISIIITAYESQDFIEECLNSVYNQTYFNDDNFEVLVGVDGCKKTYEKLNEIKYNYKNLKIFMMKDNKGTYITTNTLIEQTIFENIIRFDSDDTMFPTLVENVMDFKNDYDIVKIGSFDGIIYFKKSSMIDTLGGYQPWFVAADTELLKRAVNKLKIGNLNIKLFNRRYHTNSLTNRKDTGANSEMRNNYASLIKTKYNDSEIKIDRVVNNYNNLKNICLIYDVHGWAFYNKSVNIKKHLNNYYNFDIKKYDELINQNYYDIIICFSPACLPINLKNYENVICGISSHISNNRNERLKDFKYNFANDFVLYNNINNKNKYYTPNGVDTNFWIDNNEKNILNKKDIHIGLVGSVHRQIHKGKERLDKICKLLINDGYNIKNDSLFVDPKKYKFSNEEMLDYYKKIDIFIVSSVSEATPNPLLEAMSMGIPCITNNTGMGNLLIDNGKNGFLIDNYSDIQSYVNNIKKLIDNPDLYIEISKNSKIKIQEFDWSKMVLNYQKMFDDFLNIKRIDNDITILIKTFERENSLKNLIKSIKKFYKFINIIVINDGSKPIEINCSNVKIINTEYDIGISKGRNIGVKNIKTKYFVLCDDDFYFTDKTKLEILYNILENTDIDIIGGDVKSNGFKKGNFIKKENTLDIIDEYYEYNDKYKFYYCDYIRNFFMAKTETFYKNNILWDNDLKMGEHTLFYYKIWLEKKAKIGYCEDVKIENNKDLPSDIYTKMRNRSQEFTDKNLYKYKLNKIKINGVIRNEKI